METQNHFHYRVSRTPIRPHLSISSCEDNFPWPQTNKKPYAIIKALLVLNLFTLEKNENPARLLKEN